MFDPILFGSRLRELRKSRGEKQPAVAELLDVSVPQVSDIENGKKGTTLEKFALICEYYNVSADYLLGLTDEPKPFKRRKKAPQAPPGPSIE